MSKLSLHKVLKNSYDYKNNQKNAFKNDGFIYDSDLSNNEHQVYYNPKEKKMLYSVKGTNPLSLKDIGTDIYLASGHLKDTSRFKQEKNNLEKAKKRYNPTNTTIAGHSLGGTLSQYIAGKNDKVFTLDKGATFGQKTRSNETAFRTQGDVVSALNTNSKRMTTLKNPNFKTGIIPLDAYIAHDVNNIKGSKIFI
jgi:hypothetical protein